MQYSFGLLLLSPLIIACIRTFSVFIHEFGHGIASLLLTKGQVILYIGTYNDDVKNIKFDLGRLMICYKPAILNLGGGLCYHGPASINKSFIITLSGPLASLIFGVGTYIIFDTFVLNELVEFLLVCLFTSFFIDFLRNIIPNNNSLKLQNGLITYNDGKRLKELIIYKTYPKDFEKALQHYYQNECARAAEIFEHTFKNGFEKKDILRFALSAYLVEGDYTKAHEMSEILLKKYVPEAEELDYSGFIKGQLGDYEGGLKDLEQALLLNPRNINTQCNYAYTLFLSEKYAEAVDGFDKVLKLAPKNAYALSNRGLAKYKSGKIEDGLEEMQKAVEINKDAYAFRNLGIYYFENSNFEKALENFEYAFELNSKTHLIKNYLEATKKKLNSFKSSQKVN